MKLLVSLFLVPFAGLLVFALARKLAFLCASRRGTAVVTASILHETEDTNGDVTRYYLLAIRFEANGRGYEADGFHEGFDHPVGSVVSIRYRRRDPQDVHLAYWSSLWALAIATSIAVSFAWFAVS
ncbi:hypothetical protein RugamoR57_57390 [Duganella caerulea]|uniref:DUF3592 domain-containing protein n=1 Tax=Duganella caerulea TaxID=2885762 RepID=UPI0030E9F48F